MKRVLFALCALFAFIAPCEAATCYWVGSGGAPGGGTWSTTNGVNWANTTNGTNSTCAATGGVPKNAGDVAIIDAAANGVGSGTITVDSTMSGASIATIDTTAMANSAILDFSVNNPSMTLTTQFKVTGSGTRTIKCGTGTFTFTATNNNFWDATTITGLTLQCTGATFLVTSPGNANPQNFIGGGSTGYGTLSLGARTNGSNVVIGGANTFVSLTATAPVQLLLPLSSTNTFSSGFALAGTSTDQIMIIGNPTSTIAVGAASTASWTVFKGITGATNSITATNSFSGGANAGTLSISVPSGGGGRIIGG